MRDRSHGGRAVGVGLYVIVQIPGRALRLAGLIHQAGESSSRAAQHIVGLVASVGGVGDRAQKPRTTGGIEVQTGLENGDGRDGVRGVVGIARVPVKTAGRA